MLKIKRMLQASLKVNQNQIEEIQNLQVAGKNLRVQWEIQ